MLLKLFLFLSLSLDELYCQKCWYCYTIRFCLGETYFPLFFKLKIFFAARKCMRRPSFHMVAEFLILSTRKAGREMKFLLSNFPLLFCVKFRTFEG